MRSIEIILKSFHRNHSRSVNHYFVKDKIVYRHISIKEKDCVQICTVIDLDINYHDNQYLYFNRAVIGKNRNGSFDVLDALSRSGSLPAAFFGLHVVVSVTHCALTKMR